MGNFNQEDSPIFNQDSSKMPCEEKCTYGIYSYMEAYSVAGEIGFSWWLVEHYSAYHVNCPDGCGLGEPARGR